MEARASSVHHVHHDAWAANTAIRMIRAAALLGRRRVFAHLSVQTVRFFISMHGDAMIYLLGPGRDGRRDTTRLRDF